MSMRGGAAAGSSSLQTISDAMYDSAVDCARCDKKFHAFRRKHRCRACGNAVCANCAKTHRILPLSSLVKSTTEPVRVCDHCVDEQNQLMQQRRRAEEMERMRQRQQAAEQEALRAQQVAEARREQEIAAQRRREQRRIEMQRRTIEEKHLGPRPERSKLQRTQSLNDIRLMNENESHDDVEDAQKRAMASLPTTTTSAMPVVASIATPVREAEECAICLETMEVGHAIYTTECGHSFHWRCLKDIQMSDSSNYDKCPSCRATMKEMQIKKQCDHPRVRISHRFCRDCGRAVSEIDVKPRPNESSSQTNGPPASYRASSHGALVRCPQCQIQMRVLPHMYNMRVACPSGHMFLVQVAGGPARGSPPLQQPPRPLYPVYPGY